MGYRNPLSLTASSNQTSSSDLDTRNTQLPTLNSQYSTSPSSSRFREESAIRAAMCLSRSLRSETHLNVGSLALGVGCFSLSVAPQSQPKTATYRHHHPPLFTPLLRVTHVRSTLCVGRQGKTWNAESTPNNSDGPIVEAASRRLCAWNAGFALSLKSTHTSGGTPLPLLSASSRHNHGANGATPYQPGAKAPGIAPKANRELKARPIHRKYGEQMRWMGRAFSSCLLTYQSDNTQLPTPNSQRSNGSSCSPAPVDRSRHEKLRLHKTAPSCASLNVGSLALGVGCFPFFSTRVVHGELSRGRWLGPATEGIKIRIRIKRPAP